MFAAGHGAAEDEAEAGPADPVVEAVEPDEVLPDELVPEETEEFEEFEDTEETPELEDEPEWDPDDLDDWEDEIEEDREAEVEGGTEAEVETSEESSDDPAPRDLRASLGEWSGKARARVSAAWSWMLGQISEARIPRHEIDGRKVLAASGVVAVCLMVGVAGYFIGRGSGEDVDVARLEGEYAGKQAGAVEGATRGYAAGFKRGRDVAFRKAYSASYRRNYIRAYQDVGLDAPRPKDIEVPEP